MPVVVTASVACSCCVQTNCIVTKVTMAGRRDDRGGCPRRLRDNRLDASSCVWQLKGRRFNAQLETSRQQVVIVNHL